MKNISINEKWTKNFNKDIKEELGVLVKIKGINDKKVEEKRKPINACLAIDISSSMNSIVLSARETIKKDDDNMNDIQRILMNQRNFNPHGYMNTSTNTKLALVKEAALKAISLLGEMDTVSIVTFSSDVKVVAKNIPAKNTEELKLIINSLYASGCTDMFEGWRQSALAVAEGLKDGGINRVLLLTDGETNQGITDPDTIVSNIKALSLKGISTSAFGVGDGYNEDLLQSIADAGDGNFYYMKDPEHFEQMFCDEFNSIMTICGRNVRLSFVSNDFDDLSLINDFTKSNEVFILPSISSVNDINLVFTGVAKNENASITIDISFEDLNGVKQSESYSVRVVPNIKGAEFTNQDVVDKVNELKVAKLRKEAVVALDKGDRETALRSLSFVGATLATSSLESRTNLEANVNSLSMSLKSGDENSFRKQAVYDNYNTRNNKSR